MVTSSDEMNPEETVDAVTESLPASESPSATERAAEPGVDQAEIDDVIARLDIPGDTLPRTAIEDARRLQPQIIPRLIQLVQNAADTARRGERVRTDGHFFAFYLLTEFQAQEAFPAILDAARVSYEAGNDLFSGAMNEDLTRSFAVLALNHQETLEKLIRDPTASPPLRWAVTALYLYWVRDGVLTREIAVERLRGHLRYATENSDRELIAPLFMPLCDFAAIEAKDEIEEAFKRNMVDPYDLEEEDIVEELNGGDEHFRERLAGCPPSGIEDSIATLSEWLCYAQAPRDWPEDLWDLSDIDLLDDESEPVDYEPAQNDKPALFVSVPIRNDKPHVGRNDPCPCGSGKKYKKCCGRSQ